LNAATEETLSTPRLRFIGAATDSKDEVIHSFSRGYEPMLPADCATNFQGHVERNSDCWFVTHPRPLEKHDCGEQQCHTDG
jgi:hypothetical protein